MKALTDRACKLLGFLCNSWTLFVLLASSWLGYVAYDNWLRPGAAEPQGIVWSNPLEVLNRAPDETGPAVILPAALQVKGEACNYAEETLDTHFFVYLRRFANGEPEQATIYASGVPLPFPTGCYPFERALSLPPTTAPGFYVLEGEVVIDTRPERATFYTQAFRVLPSNGATGPHE